MSKYKYIPCDIYKRGIYIFIGGLDDFKQWAQRTFLADDEKEFMEVILALDESTCGMASFAYNMADGQGVILVHGFPTTPAEEAALVHEILHATFHVLNFCHVEYSYDGSNEAYTYLMEHLTRT